MLPVLIDSTLREGEQRFGAYYSLPDKLLLVELLTRFGVEEIECGVAGRDGELAAVLAHARALPGHGDRKKPDLSVWCSGRPEDMATAARLAPDVVSMGVPASDAHIVTRLGWTRERTLDRVAELLALARSSGVERVSVGLEDAFRADPEFVVDIVRQAQAHGAWRARLSDTVGVAEPREVAALVARVKAETGLRLGVHCHDDLGLATANALAALDTGEGGADCADVSVLGIGERAGIAKLEEVAAFLVLKRGAAYDLAVIPELTEAAAKAAGTAVPPFKAVAGERLFWCESGLHADGVFKDPALYEPFAPETVGRTRLIALGKKSGRAAVRRVLEGLGRSAGPEELERLVEQVRVTAAEKGRPLTDDEAREILAVK